MNQINSSVTSGLSWVMFQKVIQQALGFVTTIILARLLDASTFGLLALTVIFMTFAQFFIDQGMGAAIVQRKNLMPEHIDSIFWMNIGVSAILLFLGIILAEPISNLFNEPKFIPVFRVMLLNLPISAVNLVQRSLLQREMDFRLLARPAIISMVLGSVVGVSMALSGMGVWSLVCQSLIANLITIPLFWNASRWRPQMRFSGSHFREIFSFSSYVMISSMLYVLNTQIDRLLIGYFMGIPLLGVYSIAIRLVENIDNMISQITGTVFFPILSAKYGEHKDFTAILHKSFRIVGIITFPIFVGISLISVNLLPVIYGEKWIAGVPVMQVLSYMFIIYALTRVNNSAITAAGYPNIIMFLHIFSTIIHVILMVIATKKDLVFVALAYTIRVYALFPLYLITMQRMVNFNIGSFISAIYPAFGGVFLMIASEFMLQLFFPIWFTNRIVAVYISVIIGIITYPIGVYVVAPSWSWNNAKKAYSVVQVWCIKLKI